MNPLRLTVEPPGEQVSEHELAAGSLTFGRGAGCDVVVADQSMSRQHARVAEANGTWIVEDLGARNGTFLNGGRIEGSQPLAPGDVIRMGATLVRVDVGERPDAGDALGLGDLGSSIFRSVDDLHRQFDAGGATGARVAARLKALNDFHRAMAGPIELDALLDLLLERLFVALQPEEGVILLRQADGAMRTAHSRRLPGATGELLVSRRLIEEVVGKNTAALVTDIASDARFAAAQSIIGAGFRSILAAPLSDAGGCIGMVAVYSRAMVRRFGEDDLELLVSLASAAALRIRNVALAEEAAARRVQDHELALAHEIQMAMLPRQFAARGEVDLAATLIPARAVGGDLYDFFVSGDDFWFIVADAAGKGVSAALFMAVTRTLFRAIAGTDVSVAEVLARMNAELARDNERQFFVTAVAGRLDLASGELTCASAGHPAPLRLSGDGPARPLPDLEGGIALGILEDAAYDEQRTHLRAGDVVLAFTDGVTEAVDAAGRLFGDPRLVDEVTDAGRLPAAGLVAHIVTAVNQHAAAVPQEDDITVVALRYLGTTP